MKVEFLGQTLNLKHGKHPLTGDNCGLVAPGGDKEGGAGLKGRRQATKFPTLWQEEGRWTLPCCLVEEQLEPGGGKFR